MFITNPIITFPTIIIIIILTIKFLLTKKWIRSLLDTLHTHQFYKVPKFNQHMQENQLFHKVITYLNSLPSVEDSDFANLFSGNKSTDIVVTLDWNNPVIDNFLGARVYWTNENQNLILKIRKSDKRRILKPYLNHIHSLFEEIEQNRKEIRLFVNSETRENGRWRSIPFAHPATIETAIIDSDLKNKVKSDLESFVKSKQYYNRLGRVWKRSYLLCGPSGTGKSSFVAAMAKYVSYNIYNVDLSRVSDDSDLKLLLLQTSNKSIILVEDLDCFLACEKNNVTKSGILNFMDGISCGDEKILVFTMRNKENVDPDILRPGRIDVHIQFPLCDFSGFKTLASSHLGLKEHKLFPQVEEIFQGGASLSPAEIGEIMISNRTSPTRALKSVINALQANNDTRVPISGPIPMRLTKNGSGRVVEEVSDAGVFLKESGPTVKEFKKLYGLLKMGSRRKESADLDASEREILRQEIP